MTLPNKLSLARIFAVPVIVAAMLLHAQVQADQPALAIVASVCALLLVIAATVTDYYDGKLARQQGSVSTLGKLLDPLADKLLVAAVFITFVDLRIYPGWAVILILAREFLVTGLRSLASVYGRVIQADRWGKHKTGWQMGCMITVLTFMAARDVLRTLNLWDWLARDWYAQRIHDIILYILLAIVLWLTLHSGLLYLWKNRDILRDGEPPIRGALASQDPSTAAAAGAPRSTPPASI